MSKANQPKAIAAAATIQVRIIEPIDLIHPVEKRLMRRGDVFELPAEEASRLVRSGHALGHARVRIEQDHITIGNRVCQRGDLGWLPPDRAEHLESKGAVTIVTPAPESRPQPTPAA